MTLYVSLSNNIRFSLKNTKFRGPLNNVLGIVTYSVDEIYSLPNLPDECKKYLLQVEKAFDMIGDLSRQLLTIGKNNVWNDIAMVDVSSVVHQAVELASKHSRIRSCRVSVHLPPTPFAIRTNPRIVEQCVLNLMLNAADAVKSEGRIDVILREENGAALIEVHDNGLGIPEADRDKIFDAFYTTKIHGTGLGLAGVKVSVELLSGSVTVGDSPLGGAMFRLLLPAVKE
jgi:signal transduction histidine kinase